MSTDIYEKRGIRITQHCGGDTGLAYSVNDGERLVKLLEQRERAVEALRYLSQEADGILEYDSQHNVLPGCFQRTLRSATTLGKLALAELEEVK